MSVQTGVSRSSSQTFAVLIWNVLASARVPVPLGQPKVNDIGVMLPLAYSHQEVVRFYVSVQVKARVNVLDSLDHLIGEHEYSFEAKFSTAFSKEFFKAVAQSVHDHHVPLLVCTKPVHLRYSNSIMQDLVNLVLIQKLRLTHWNRLFLGHTVLLVLIFRVNILQVFYLHSKCELIQFL